MVTKELLDYISAQRGQGMTDDDIRQSLLESAWPAEEVDLGLMQEENAGSLPLNTPEKAVSIISKKTIYVVVAVLCLVLVGVAVAKFVYTDKGILPSPVETPTQTDDAIQEKLPNETTDVIPMDEEANETVEVLSMDEESTELPSVDSAYSYIDKYVNIDFDSITETELLLSPFNKDLTISTSGFRFSSSTLSGPKYSLIYSFTNKSDVALSNVEVLLVALPSNNKYTEILSQIEANTSFTLELDVNAIDFQKPVRYRIIAENEMGPAFSHEFFQDEAKKALDKDSVNTDTTKSYKPSIYLDTNNIEFCHETDEGSIFVKEFGEQCKDDSLLTERYCAGGELLTKRAECENGCSYGACNRI
jgi:hypothetical protein